VAVNLFAQSAQFFLPGDKPRLAGRDCLLGNLLNEVNCTPSGAELLGRGLCVDLAA
jgi:hypothetical protein